MDDAQVASNACFCSTPLRWKFLTLQCQWASASGPASTSRCTRKQCQKLLVMELWILGSERHGGFWMADSAAKSFPENFDGAGKFPPGFPGSTNCLAHQNRTIAIASDCRVDRAKSQEISQKDRVSVSEIATRNHKSLATFHRTLKSQCKVSEIASDFWGPWWASQSQIAKIAAISVR